MDTKITNHWVGFVQYHSSGSSGPPLPAPGHTKNRLNAELSMFAVVALQNKHFTKKRQLYVKKKTAMVMRSIIISVLNLVLNLPSHILRTWLTLDDNGIDHKTLEILEPISQILYFSQFICNAFYLSTSIYETSGTPRNTVVTFNFGYLDELWAYGVTPGVACTKVPAQESFRAKNRERKFRSRRFPRQSLSAETFRHE
ncbi:hypothetical protein ANCDUO_23776 [Ancylostoma duodenale]|uniref:Uncharacterized protein n=1 Tax=Ancylostoma duodenale TaxID=51022 RepID=A0A0C2BQV7_9BILA|nr:hypothetical protein ANCDUO_23776 [Ancylostoma duodenale]